MEITELQQLIDQAQKIVFLTGAGSLPLPGFRIIVPKMGFTPIANRISQLSIISVTNVW